MNRRTILAATILVLVAGVLVMLVVLNSTHYPTRTLPDGSRLSVAFVGYTNTLFYRHYRPAVLQRFLNEKLPANWRIRLGLKNPGGGGFRLGSDGTTFLALVTRQEGGSTNNPIKLERILVVDQNGLGYEAVSDAITLNEPGEIIQGWRFRAFPRRQKTVRCRFIYKTSSGHYASAAEIDLPNPARGRHPDWISEPVPVAKRDGDLEVTLLDFAAGLNHEQEVEPKDRWYWIGRQTTRAVFKVQQAGRERLSWKLQSLLIADATGNHWKPSLENPPGIAQGDGNLVAEFIGALWPSEPAWRLRIEFSRTNDFMPEELWTLPDVPVPLTNQVLMINTSHEANGNSLHIVAAGGVNAELPEPFQSLAMAQRVNLAVQMKSSDHRLTLVKIVDDAGRLIPSNEPSPWYENEHSFAFEVPAGAKSFNATFAIHQSRFVEFTAKPIQVGKASN
jgi:hypothetical protein